jgi:tripartite-type tricarboxylate transporter receptor subunit TctC
MPDLPTVAEAGVPGFKADVCFGIVVPFGTLGDIRKWGELVGKTGAHVD